MEAALFQYADSSWPVRVRVPQNWAGLQVHSGFLSHFYPTLHNFVFFAASLTSMICVSILEHFVTSKRSTVPTLHVSSLSTSPRQPLICLLTPKSFLDLSHICALLCGFHVASVFRLDCIVAGLSTSLLPIAQGYSVHLVVTWWAFALFNSYENAAVIICVQLLLSLKWVDLEFNLCAFMFLDYRLACSNMLG